MYIFCWPGKKNRQKTVYMLNNLKTHDIKKPKHSYSDFIYTRRQRRATYLPYYAHTSTTSSYTGGGL